MAKHKQSSVSSRVEKDYHQIIANLTGFDDIFFNALLQKNKEGAEYLLRIILGIPDLVIIGEPEIQKFIQNVHGRSIRLDCYSESIGKRIDVEMQRDDRGASALRARYNASVIDADNDVNDEYYADLPDTYVIFITEHDIFKAGEPIYEIERVILNTGKLFNDGAHIIYVNGEYRGNDDIGRLMYDLHCRKPEDMHDSPLRKKAAELKETEEGVKHMSTVLASSLEQYKNEIYNEVRDEVYNDVRNEVYNDVRDEVYSEVHDKALAEGKKEGKAEGIEEARRETALRMLKRSNNTIQEIAEDTGLDISQVKKLKKSLMS